MTIPTRRRYGAALACGALLALVACGGGDDEPSAADVLADLENGEIDESDLEDLLGELGDGELGDLGDVDLGDLGDLGGVFGEDGPLGDLEELFSEDGLEELIEEQSGEDVDIDIGDDGFSFETEDGGISVDGDGNFTVTDEEGNETTGEFDLDDDGFSVESDDGSFSVGSSEELPDDWPSSVPRPDGLDIQQVTSVDDETVMSFSVTGTFDGDHADWVGTYGGALEDAGFAQEEFFETGDDVSGFYSSDEYEVFVTTSSVAGSALISITLVSVES